MPQQQKRLEESLESLTELAKPSQRVGYLGIVLNNQYLIADPTDTRFFYVRFEEEGTYIRVLHRGLVSPTPDLPVRVEFSVYDNADVISGVANEYIAGFAGGDYAGNLSVGPHTHERGSAMAFPIDLRLIYPFQIRPHSGMTVKLMPGLYQHGNTVKSYAESQINLTSLIPTGTSEHRIAVIGIDPSDSSLVAVGGTPKSTSIPMTNADVAAVPFDWANHVPACAIRLYTFQSSFVESDLYAFQFMPHPSEAHWLERSNGLLSPLLGSGVEFPSLTTAEKNAIVTPAEGSIVYDETLEKMQVYSGGAWKSLGGGILVKEIDGDPSVADVSEIRVANGSLTDLGGGVIELTTGGGGGGSGSPGTVATTKEEFYTETVIYDETLGANGSFENIAIPAGYDELEIIGDLQSTKVTDSADAAIFFNGDMVSSNYAREYWYGYNNTSPAGRADDSHFASVPAASSPANVVGSFKATIFSPSSSYKKNILSMSAVRRGDASHMIVAMAVNWESTAAITSVTIRTDTHPTDLFVAGSRLQIIAKKKTEVVTDVSGFVFDTPVESIVLDYVMPASGSDVVDGVTATANAWTNFSTARTFTLAAAGLVDINVRGSMFARNESGSSSYVFGVLVDGTTSYNISGDGGVYNSSTGFSRDTNVLSGINTLTIPLSAGEHTLQFRVYNRDDSGSATMYCRPGIPSEFFAVQVIYHSEQQVGPLRVTTEEHEVRELIYDTTLGSNGSFGSIAIPSGYDSLELDIHVRSTSATGPDAILLFFNGDTTSTNYRRQSFAGYDGTTENVIVDSAQILGAPSASAQANEFSSARAIVQAHSSSDHRKIVRTWSAYRSSDSLVPVGFVTTSWENTAAITSVELRTDNHPTDLFAAGSRVQIFGVKKSQVVTGVTGAIVPVADPTGIISANSEEIYTEKVIYDVTLSANGSFENIAIPPGYDELEMVVGLRSTAAVTGDSIYLFFNGDTTQTNYSCQYMSAIGGTANAGRADVPFISGAPGASSIADDFSNIIVRVFAPSSSKRKTSVSLSGNRRDSTTQDATIASHNWESTAPVTSVTLRTDNHPTDLFVAGSRLQITAKKKISVVTSVEGSMMGIPVDSLVLDYTMPVSPTTDHVIMSLPANTWTNFSNQRSFTISSAGLVDINVRGSAWAQNASGTACYTKFGVLVDGTTRYELSGSAYPSTWDDYSNYGADFLAGINTLTLDLSAGTHTLQFQVYNASGPTINCYCRAGNQSEHFAVQVVYHAKQQVAPLTVTTEDHEVRELIYDETLSASGSFEGISIPAGYDRLIIEAKLRGTASGSNDALRLFFNGDTANSNYYSRYLNATTDSLGTGRLDLAYTGESTTSTSPADNFAAVSIVVDDVSGSHHKTYRADQFSRESSTDSRRGFPAGVWESTAAITSITLRTDNHPTDLFAAGSRLQIFGVKTSTVVTDINGAVVVDSLNKYVCFGRLTLTSGTPVTTSDVTAAGTLYFTPYKGDMIGLYSAGAWTVRSFGEVSLSLAALNANTNYDIFAYDNTGAVALEAHAWTNDTTRATALTMQNGIYVKSGDTSRRYLGTIRTVAAGQTEDSLTKRFVWNYYNRERRELAYVDTTGSYTYNSGTVRQAHALAAFKLEIVSGLRESVISLIRSVRTSGGTWSAAGIGVNVTTTHTVESFSSVTVDHGRSLSYVTTPALGYTYYAATEAVAGTVTIDAASVGPNQSLRGEWMA